MSYDQNYPFPQVFLVDNSGGPQHSTQPPSLVPCWSFPPAQERVRSRGKSRGCMGVSPGLLLVLLLLLLLLFAALGLGAYQIYKIQRELAKMKQEVDTEKEFHTPEKQVGLYEPELNREKTDSRPAAHVIGRIHTDVSHKTLRWEPRVGRAFTAGGVVYRIEDGALQVNDTGLYHIYSRVELRFRHCSQTDSFVHSVFVRRAGHPLPLTLMEGHRVGFCSQKQSYFWTSASYLGSALQLQERDRVFVNVSHPTNLSQQHHANFFGLYKI
ncbi:tumor necrosis factor ligand superfamily member 6 [Centroberyx affinis]|uniref:tumor necrosis factor ligand superfamily member 6 n=1 Tax=Centroberyx affinis TaxID=166261 RepID=UPI003A5BA000